MFRTVVVGTDGSETASIAVGRAAEMAALSGAELVIVSAYKPIPTRKLAAERASLPEEYGWMLHDMQQVNGVLADAQRLAATRGARATVDAAIGDPVEVILNAAAEHKADLVVIGSRGMERRVMGSVPNGVAHRAMCDVYIVHTS